MLCPYCLNIPRLPLPPGQIAQSLHTDFDCPVCQENRVTKEERESSVSEEPDFEFIEEFDNADTSDLFNEDEEEDDEDYDEFGED